jgi:hypothetical protein
MSLEHDPIREGKRFQARAPPFAEPAVYTFAEFCRAHRISRSKLYRLLREGRGPRVMAIDSHHRISREAAADWRHAQELAEQTEHVRKARAQKRAEMRARRAAGLTAKAAAETLNP